MRIKKLFVLALALVMLTLMSDEARAQTGDIDSGYQEVCKNVPLAGASRVVVAVKDNDQVLLVGMKGTKAVWEKSFPLRQDVNKAKTFAECRGRTIELHSQQPFSAAEIIQVFSWDGRRLKFISTRFEDPSAKFVAEMVKAAETGDIRTLRSLMKDEGEGDVGVMYPHVYINRQLFADAIKRGHRAAEGLFKLGRAREAATRLALMFDLTSRLNRILGIDEETALKPDRWLQAWKVHEMTASEYVYALNDYGYFLQQAGNHVGAVAIFAAVIHEDTGRTVAYLNLADSLWTLNRKSEARAHYKTYQELMVRANRHSQIPARVPERAS